MAPRLLCSAAVVKTAVLTAAALAMAATIGTLDGRSLVQAVLLAAFTIAGAMLVVGGRLDPAAPRLGAFMALVASAFADALAWRTGADHASGVRAVIDIRLDAWMPALLWAFVGAFPRHDDANGRTPRAIPAVVAVCAMVGGVLFVANLVASPDRPTDAAWWLSRRNRTGIYWPLLIGLMLPIAPTLWWRTRRASPVHRRRVTLFVAAITAGLLPMAVDIVLVATLPGFAAWTTGATRMAIESVAFAALLSVPFTTAYAVLVHRVVDVQFIVRMAIRHALARYSLVGVTALPFVAAATVVAQRRDVPVDELLGGPTLAWLIGSLGAGVLMTMVRRRLIEAIDRCCFREHYDAQQILTALVDRVRATASVDELADLLCAEVDRALHLHGMDVLVSDTTGTWMNATRRRDVRFGIATLATLPESHTATIDTERLAGMGAPVNADSSLSRWIAQQDMRLLVPLRASDGAWLGLLGLGPKRSELPFSREDRLLLANIGTSAALFLENRRMRESRDAQRPAPGSAPAETLEAALECDACRTVYPRDTSDCPCGGPLVKAPVPRLLHQKFRFDRRIGEGGMGVVYKATDLDLRRSIAIKLLPLPSTEGTLRLQREAQAMASMSHPNLAVVFGLESWRGVPFLLVEYLSGGTLDERLQRGRLSWIDTLNLGLTLADALAHIHAAGMLHRDIKPSNIGFTGTGIPKLLDFGLVRLMETWWPQDPTKGLTRAYSAATTVWEEGDLLTRQLMVGTPAYMSPETVRREHPDIRVDLWSVMVVLFECLTGRNPFRRPTLGDTFARIADGPPPPLDDYLDSCPPALRDFFHSGLSPDPSRRPASAERLHERLTALRASLQEA